MHIMVVGPRSGEKARSSFDFEAIMRRIIVLSLALSALAMGPARSGEDPDMAAFVQESRGLVKAFAGQLQGALKAAIKEGGAVHAIPVCNTVAPKIARESAPNADWTVGRTSHRLRNPGNAPDAWEEAVLAAFIERMKAGEDPKKMEQTELLQGDGQQTLRYMKAIPTGKVCLNCHGSEIAREVQAQITALYPDDRATGFKLGELRGAFTITKKLGD